MLSTVMEVLGILLLALMIGIPLLGMVMDVRRWCERRRSRGR